MPARGYYLPQRGLVSQEDAAFSERANIPRSRFIGSWNVLTTFDAGYLVPFMVEEILPGDHMSYRVTAYVRMSTPLFPIFSNQRIDTFFFFVPCRLVWDNWVKFMGETDNPTDSIDFTIPTATSPVGGYGVCSLQDYMGLPVDLDVAGTYTHNNLPVRAYALIWNQWFRDQNIQESVVVDKDDGPDTASDYDLLRRAKAHDYFTKALPWPQKFTAPNVPLDQGGMAPVLGLGVFVTSASSVNSGNVVETGAGVTQYPFYKALYDNAAGNQVAMEVDQETPTGTGAPLVFANLADAAGFSINAFRTAYMVQEFLERDARGGTRYVEQVFTHFGVRPPDFRLQRPEYIGGGQTPLNITPIAQTAPDAGGGVVGALGAAGTGSGSHTASYAATEHGYILGLINIRTELGYQQGVHKMYDRSTRFDIYDPAFAGLGEQAILRKEIYAIGAAINDDVIFGYQERWQEYRERYSEVRGMFRSGISGTLDAWHLAQQFSSAPLLTGTTFIVDNPPMDRVLAAGELAENQQYLADIMIERTAVRPIPTFGTPSGLGRF